MGFLAFALIYPIYRLGGLALTGGPVRLDRVAWLGLRNSIVLSLGVAVCSIVVCFIPAWVLARWNFRGKLLLRTALTLPLTFSGVVVGFLAILMIGRVGFIPVLSEKLLGISLLGGAAYTPLGLVMAYLYFEIPRATLALESAFSEFDSDLEAAAATLGAAAGRRMFRLIIPMLFPALVATFFLTFSVSLGSYGVALMLSRRLTLVPMEIYTSFTGFLDDQRAAILSLALIAISLSVSLASRLIRRLT